MARELTVKVIVDKDSAKAGLAEVERGVQQLTASSEQQEKAMKAALGVLTAQNVRQFVGDLKAAAAEFINAFAEQEKATRSLTAALQAAGSFTPELGAQYDALATHFEDTTVFSDELIVSMESLLTQVGSVGPAQMGNALKAATDLSAGLGIDLRTATLLVAKAFEGHTETLGRYGIVLDETKLKADPIGAVLEGINEKFGGQAQAQLDTYSGKMQQLSNRMNNTQESAGHLLTSGISPLIGVFNSLEGPVQTTILGFGGIVAALLPAALSFATLAPSIAVLATSNLPLLTTAISGAGAALGVLAPIVAVVATAFVSWEIGRWIGEVSGLTDEFERFGAVMMGTSVAEVNATIAAREHAAAMRELQPLIDKAERGLPKFTANLHDTRLSLNDAEAAMKELEEQTKKNTRTTEDAGRKLAQTYSAQMKTTTAYVESVEKIEKDMLDVRRAATDAFYKEQERIAVETGKHILEDTVALNKSLISLDSERLRNLLAVNMPQMVAGANQAGKLTGQAMGTSLFAGFGDTIARAVEGGGSVLKSVGSQLGKNLTGHIFGAETMQHTITDVFGKTMGAAFNALLPGIGAIVGPLIGKIGSFFADVFGGPNGMEKAGRALSDAFAQTMAGTLDWMQQIEVHQLIAAGGSKKWAETIIGVRDAYLKAGHTAEEAAAMVNRLFAAEKQGGNAVQLVIDEITRSMHDTLPAALDVTADKFHTMSEVGVMAFAGISTAAADAGVASAAAADAAIQAWKALPGYMSFNGGSSGEGTSEGKNESEILKGLSPEQARGVYLGEIANKGSTDQDWERVKGQYGFHNGGMIYAHSGLAIDEVPIIAQRGEGVLSRRGMRNLGGPMALNSLNSGGGGGGGNVEGLLRELIAAVHAGHTISIDGDAVAAATVRAIKPRVGHRGF